MSEEIIIDGVNVAGCIYYNAEKIANCGMFALGDFKCEGQICLYKQLKRLQAENERLSNMKCPNCGEEYLSPTGADLFEENERLKVEIKDQEDLANECLRLGGKYLQALEEIRKIAENYFKECGVPDDYFKRNNYSWKQHQIKGLTCKLQQILDKISEVLDERN